MNPNLEKVETKIKSLESKILKNDEELKKAVDQKNKNDASVEKFKLELEKLLVANDTKKINAARSKLNKLKEETEPGTLLISGLQKQRDDLKKELAKANRERDKIISKLCVKLISVEVNGFDAAVKKVILAGQRLACLHEILRERGRGEVYMEAIGPAASYLPGIKLPLIKKFDRTVFVNGGQFRFNKDLRNQVYTQMTEVAD